MWLKTTLDLEAAIACQTASSHVGASFVFLWASKIYLSCSQSLSIHFLLIILSQTYRFHLEIEVAWVVRSRRWLLSWAKPLFFVEIASFAAINVDKQQPTGQQKSQQLAMINNLSNTHRFSDIIEHEGSGCHPKESPARNSSSEDAINPSMSLQTFLIH